MSEHQYEELRAKLAEAYRLEDHYLIAFYLATLRAPEAPTYEHLRKAVTHDTSACTNIFQVNYLAEQGFYRHIYRRDTIEFKNALNLCLQKLGSNAYAVYRQRELEKTALYLASREPLDSALFDWDLIAILKEIGENDQVYRKARASLKISDTEKERLFDLQVRLDSINLLRVDSILTNFGYPTKEKVGHDYSKVVVMVIHHQSDPAVRQAYLDRIRKYISLEEVELIERRTQRMLREN